VPRHRRWASREAGRWLGVVFVVRVSEYRCGYGVTVGSVLGYHVAELLWWPWWLTYLRSLVVVLEGGGCFFTTLAEAFTVFSCGLCCGEGGKSWQCRASTVDQPTVDFSFESFYHHSKSLGSSSGDRGGAWSAARGQRFLREPRSWYEAHICISFPFLVVAGRGPTLVIASLNLVLLLLVRNGSKSRFLLGLETWANGSWVVLCRFGSVCLGGSCTWCLVRCYGRLGSQFMSSTNIL
jgi:hypothetical protein